MKADLAVWWFPLNKLRLVLAQLIAFGVGLNLANSLAWHFWPEWSFIKGIRVDYLSPSLSPIELLMFGLWCLGLNRCFIKPRFNLKAITIFAIISSLLSVQPEVSFFRWFKLLEIWWIYNLSLLFPLQLKKGLKVAFLITITLGVLQLVYQHNVSSIFKFLGEPVLSLYHPGVAKLHILGLELLRPYGTLQHPNVWGIWVLLAGIILGSRTRVVSVCMSLLSFSRNLYLGLLLWLMRTHKKSWHLIFVVSSLMIIIWSLQLTPLSVSQRITQYVLPANNLREILFGSGLGTYIINQCKTSNQCWKTQFQPVHSLPLLLMKELGLVGFACIIFIFKKQVAIIWHNKFAGSLFFTTALFDHYWLTNWQLMVLLGVYFAL